VPLPRLIAIDLDGTLLTSDKRISDRSAAAIAAARAAGAEVLLCTGRPPRGVRAYAQALSLPRAVVYNGATTVDFAADSAEHHHQLDEATARTVLARMHGAFPDLLAGMETAHGWYLEPATYRLRRPMLEAQGLPHPDGVGALDGFVRGPVIKLFFRHPERSVAELAAAIADLDVYRTWSGEALLEVMHPAVNKRDALVRVAAGLGVTRAEVAAFGDERNDREMLAWAGCGVAMAGASAEIRNGADLVCGDNDEDGVAQVLEDWLRGRAGD
jgi:Cof subfamily protein (haloacid dehalogenase superfamily)